MYPSNIILDTVPINCNAHKSANKINWNIIPCVLAKCPYFEYTFPQNRLIIVRPVTKA